MRRVCHKHDISEELENSAPNTFEMNLGGQFLIKTCTGRIHEIFFLKVVSTNSVLYDNT